MDGKLENDMVIKDNLVCPLKIQGGEPTNLTLVQANVWTKATQWILLHPLRACCHFMMST